MAPSIVIDWIDWIDWIAIVMVIAGFCVTAGGFLYRLRYVQDINGLELTWNFITLNVAVMTAGLFLLFRNLHAQRSNSLVWRWIDDIVSHELRYVSSAHHRAEHGSFPDGSGAGEPVPPHTGDRIHNFLDYLSRGQATFAFAEEPIPHWLGRADGTELMDLSLSSRMTVIAPLSPGWDGWRERRLHA